MTKAPLSMLIAEYRRRLPEVGRRVSERMSDLEITGVPFDQGSAQASFHPSTNGATKPYREVTGGSRYPQRSTVRAVARALGLGDTYSLIGNAPHLRRLEYGHSGQAPAGFHRIAIMQFQSVTDDVVQGLAR